MLYVRSSYWGVNFLGDNLCQTHKAHSEHNQRSKMTFFDKIVNGFQLLTTSEQSSILDFWQGSEYTYFSFRDTSIIEPKCCFRKRKWIISCQKDKLFSHSLFPSSSFFIIKIILRGSRRESRICDIRRFFMRYSM